MLQPLLADIGDVIGLLITIAIIGFSVISKIISVANDGKGKNAPQRRQPPNQPRAGQKPPQRQPGAQSIKAEIDEFLRQARGGQPPRQPAAGQPVAGQPVRRPAGVIKAVPIEATPIEDAVVPGRRFTSDLTSHVEEHIGRDSISRRDAHLGDITEAADERVEHHLEEVFDHDVGHLAHADDLDTSVSEGTDAADSTGEKQPNSAAAIAEMLKTRQSVRNAFVVAEILKRPEF